MASTALLFTVGCGSNTGAGSGSDDPADDPSSSEAPQAMPTVVPPPDGEVTARTTVLEKDRPELCLGGVLESLPPQCGGPPIDGWSWNDFVEGEDFDSAGGVRWGEFVVWGSWDGTTFTLTRAQPADEVAVGPPPDEPDPFRTRCDEPDGGWVVDPGKVDFAAQDGAFAAARRLDGYAGSFVDTSPDPRTAEEADAAAAAGDDDASHWIVNVAVTGDLAAAEYELREHWGGGICVFRAEHSEAELRRIQHDLHELPGFLGSGSGIDRVDASVMWDDGSLQQWADATYGEGLVDIYSAMRLA